MTTTVRLGSVIADVIICASSSATAAAPGEKVVAAPTTDHCPLGPRGRPEDLRGR